MCRQSLTPTNAPGGYDVVRTNHVSLPPDLALSPVGVGWYYGIGNPTNQPVSFDLITDLTVTNDLGNYLQVLAGMNDSLGRYYRYESGTSMAAADVSGTLALMQEFFQRAGPHQQPRPHEGPADQRRPLRRRPLRFQRPPTRSIPRAGA